MLGHQDMKDIDYESLDAGIRELVKALREHGIETTDSGDGVSKLEGCAPGETAEGVVGCEHVAFRVDRHYCRREESVYAPFEIGGITRGEGPWKICLECLRFVECNRPAEIWQVELTRSKTTGQAGDAPTGIIWRLS